MTGDHQVETLTLYPLLGFRLGQPLPGKRGCSLGLVRPIHPDCIVHFGATEAVSITTLTDILIRPGIQQKGATVALQAYVQRVGMARTASVGCLGTRVPHELSRRLGGREQLESGR